MENGNAYVDISVVIPAYNAENYIGDALESVLSQKPSFRQVIVVDDGSIDGTRRVVQQFKDPHILYHYQNHSGQGPARNAGIDRATGDYIQFLDSDDTLDPNFTRRVHELVVDHSHSLGLICFSGNNISWSTGAVLASSKHLRWVGPGLYAHGEAALVANISDTGSAKLPAFVMLYVIRRALLGREPKLRFLPILHEDAVFTPELFLRCKGNVCVASDVLYRRRVRPGSLSETGASVEDVHGFLIAARTWQDIARRAVHGNGATYLRESQEAYAQALRYAAKSGLSAGALKRMVLAQCPSFLDSTTSDYALMRVYRRLAVTRIRHRGVTLAKQ